MKCKKNWTWYNRLHSKNSKIIRTIIMSACVDCVDMFRTLCTCWLKKNVGHENKKNWKICSSLHVDVVIPKKSVDVYRAWFLLLLQLFLLKYGLLLWKLWFRKDHGIKTVEIVSHWQTKFLCPRIHRLWKTVTVIYSTQINITNIIANKIMNTNLRIVMYLIDLISN